MQNLLRHHYSSFPIRTSFSENAVLWKDAAQLFGRPNIWTFRPRIHTRTEPKYRDIFQVFVGHSFAFTLGQQNIGRPNIWALRPRIHTGTLKGRPLKRRPNYCGKHQRIWRLFENPPHWWIFRKETAFHEPLKKTAQWEQKSFPTLLDFQETANIVSRKKAA